MADGTIARNLRRLLYERGIEYDDESYLGSVFWGNASYEQFGDGHTRLIVEDATPEQAIAATVDGGMTLDEATEYAERFMGDYSKVLLTSTLYVERDEPTDQHALNVAEQKEAQMARTLAEALATVGTEPDEATMLKLHDRMNAALLDYESAMGIEGGNGANTVPFVIEMHSLLEDAATMGARGTCKDLGGVGADDEVVFNCSECCCVLSVFDKDGGNNLCTSFIYDYPRFCPECGRRIIEEVTE